MKKLLLILALVSMLCLPLAHAQESNATTGTETPTNETTVQPVEPITDDHEDAESDDDADDSDDDSDKADDEADEADDDADEADEADDDADEADEADDDADDADDGAVNATSPAPEAETAPVNEEIEEVLENGNLEAELAPEASEEEQEVVKTELEVEAATVEPTLPGGFSRFISGIGDTFTFNKKAKAKRALERARENKLRILAKMNEKQTGLAKSQKWAEEMKKLQEYVAEDMAKAEEAIEAVDGSSESDLEEASEINEELNEQEALDELVTEEAQETAQTSADLSSEELAQLGTVGTALEQTTAVTKGKAKKEVLETAGKLLAKGKKISEVKAAKDKAVKHKDLREKSKTEYKKEVKTETKNGKVKTETKTEVKTEVKGKGKTEVKTESKTESKASTKSKSSNGKNK